MRFAQKWMLVAAAVLMLAACSKTKGPSTETSAAAVKPPAGWQSDLYSPTEIVQLDDKWILVDCWHSRILWNTRLDPDVSHWHTLESDFSAHSMAYDGHRYWVTEDTEHGAVVVYVFENGNFKRVGYLDGLGRRTHRTRYDAQSNTFLTLSAVTGDMWRYRVDQGKPVIVNHVRLSFAMPGAPGFELRTFTLHDGKVYFVSSIATHKVYVTTDDDTYNLLAAYEVTQPLQDMESLYFLPDGHIMASAWPSGFVIVNDLKDLASAPNQFERYGFHGSPYYVSTLHGDYLLPEIGDHNGVALWTYANGELHRKEQLIPYTQPGPSDRARKAEITFQTGPG